MRALCVLLVGVLLSVWVSGCGDTKKYYFNDTAPVTTQVVVVQLDPFTAAQIEQLNDSIAQIVSALQADFDLPDINVVVNVTKNVVNVKFNGRAVLVCAGEDFELPGLYEAICRLKLPFRDDDPIWERVKNRCKQVTEDCRRKNRGRHDRD